MNLISMEPYVNKQAFDVFADYMKKHRLKAKPDDKLMKFLFKGRA